MGDQLRWHHVTITHEGGVLRVSGTDVDWVDIQTALRFHFGKLRGWHEDQSPSGIIRTPRTTWGDVAELAVFWTAELAKARKVRSEMQGRRDRWRAAVEDLRATPVGTKPTTIYPKNREFWRAMQGVAIACDVERDMADPPSRTDAVIGFFTETIPDAVGDALGWIGDKLESGAAATGRAAGAAGRGLFDGLGAKPVLIGLGAIAGAAILIPALSNRNTKTGGAS